MLLPLLSAQEEEKEDFFSDNEGSNSKTKVFFFLLCLILVYIDHLVLPHKLPIYLMSLRFGLAFPFILVTLGSPAMHGLPCSSLGHCFGSPSDVSPDPSSVQESNVTPQNDRREGPPAAPVTAQPEAPTSGRHHPQHEQPERIVSCSATYSARISSLNGISSSFVCRLQAAADSGLCFESPRLSLSASRSSEDDDLDVDYSPAADLNYPHIPRPSIVIRQPQVGRVAEWFQ